MSQTEFMKGTFTNWDNKRPLNFSFKYAEKLFIKKEHFPKNCLYKYK